MTNQSVAVIGGGIIGLSTATYLKSVSPNMNITILSEQLTPHTTGDGAAGVWGPVYLSNTSEENIRKWSGKTYEYLAALTRDPDSSKYGVFFQQLFDISKSPITKYPHFHRSCYGFHEMTPAEMSMFPGTKSGVSYLTLISEGRFIISYMMKKFLELGGKIIQQKVDSFDEVFNLGYSMIVNCTGLGARELCQDKNMYPIRGHILKMKAPWIKFIVFDDNGKYIVPGSLDNPPATPEFRLNNQRTKTDSASKDYVVLGGTTDKDSYNTEPKETDRIRIRNGCEKIFPSLKNAEWVGEWVGLRPGRTTVRLEKEMFQHKVTGNKYPVVHNYGHGGAGLTMFWGCAEDAARLILEEFDRARL